MSHTASRQQNTSVTVTPRRLSVARCASSSHGRFGGVVQPLYRCAAAPLVGAAQADVAELGDRLAEVRRERQRRLLLLAVAQASKALSLIHI
eukprot:81324-Chlamydomonas_euryale.AAC.4